MVRTTDRRPLRVITTALLALLLSAFAAPAAPAQGPAGSPVALTSAATHVAHRSVVLEGSVTPGQQATSYHFEYGPTTDYGTTTQGTLISGAILQHVSAPISGLHAGTTYHYRVVASSPAGIVVGADMTVTTLTETPQPADPAPAPTPAPTPAPPAPSKSKAATRFHVAYTVTPEGLTLRQVAIRSQARGARLTISCRRCVPRLLATSNLAAVAGIRMPRGALLIAQDRLHGYYGIETRMRLRNYAATHAAMVRIAADPFVVTTRTLGPS